MAYELEGTLKVVMDVMKFNSGFTKREFVVTIGDDRYPQDIKLEFVKDKVTLLDRYRPGQKVKVGFDLRGGEHNGRYYVNLQAWRIHPAEGGESSAPAPEQGDGERSGRDFSGREGGPPRGDRRDRGGRGGNDREYERRGGGGGRNFGARRGTGDEDDDIDF